MGVKQLQAAVAALVNLAMVTAALAAPALLASDETYILESASLVVGVQAGSSAVIQVGRDMQAALGRGLAWLWMVPAVACGVLADDFTEGVLSVIVATSAGAAVGALIGSASLRVMVMQGGARFQMYQAMRSIGVFASILVGIAVDSTMPGLGGALAVAGVVILAAFTARRSLEGQKIPTKRATIFPIILGLIGSLYYRNDVNWVRSFSVELEQFPSIHFSLIAYTVLQAMTGFAVVQILFVDRGKWHSHIAGASSRTRISAALIWIVTCAVTVFVVSSTSVVLGLLSISLLAIMVGVLSGLAHVKNLSWVPYTAGILGVSVLIGILTLTGQPATALLFENIVIGTLILLVLLFPRRMKSSSLR